MLQDSFFLIFISYHLVTLASTLSIPTNQSSVLSWCSELHAVHIADLFIITYLLETGISGTEFAQRILILDIISIMSDIQ